MPQNETTPFYPRSPYGVSKLFAHWITVNYREAYGLFACSRHSLQPRIARYVDASSLPARLRSGWRRWPLGKQDTLDLGNLDAQRDWGYAAEYVEGMWMMLQQDEPDDYVLATGRTHSVRDFVNAAGEALGFDLEWSGEGANARGIDRRTGKAIVIVTPEFYRPAEVDLLIGDPRKAKQKLNWEAQDEPRRARADDGQGRFRPRAVRRPAALIAARDRPGRQRRPGVS